MLPGLCTDTPSSVLAVDFLPDGELLFSGSDDNKLGIWKYRDADPTPRLIQRQAGPVSALAVTSQGDLLATGSHGGKVLLWDVARNVLKTSQMKSEGQARSLGFSASGKRMVIAKRRDGLVPSFWSAIGLPSLC